MLELKVTFNPKEHKRIFAKIIIDKKTKCWNWQGSVDQQGYGLLWYKQRTERIHRVMYALFKNPIPRSTKKKREFTIDHACRNHTCCNPEHLELVTHRVNVLRGIGPSAINARKTHCKNGHSFTKNNRRYCNTCDNIRHKKRMQGPNREYWLKKQREATNRYNITHKT